MGNESRIHTVSILCTYYSSTVYDLESYHLILPALCCTMNNLLCCCRRYFPSLGQLGLPSPLVVSSHLCSAAAGCSRWLLCSAVDSNQCNEGACCWILTYRYLVQSTIPTFLHRIPTRCIVGIGCFACTTRTSRVAALPSSISCNSCLLSSFMHLSTYFSSLLLQIPSLP